ncbi:hypothetical protein FLW53_27915 [Microbispora sp. SCL1-1]|nr:hypothetical protein FLW53_27915 [Microbispora sp. SCL1-1]
MTIPLPTPSRTPRRARVPLGVRPCPQAGPHADAPAYAVAYAYQRFLDNLREGGTSASGSIASGGASGGGSGAISSDASGGG